MKLTALYRTLAAAGLIAAAGTGHAADVKVGVVLTYSGGAAQFGQQIDRGMNLYLKQHGADIGGLRLTRILVDRSGHTASGR